MKTLMIQGTASSVGKSVLVASFCRIFRQDGFCVAPFKSQNIALNSFISVEGGEMGRSQAMQAQAAGVEPSVDMNPILIKPEADSRSQMVVLGKPWTTKSASDYDTYRQRLWQVVVESLERLSHRYDLLIIEGAGSPAEINLKKHEMVNMRVAKHVGAPVLLTGDIDRGGVFASLFGTINLLDHDERELIRGFIINKFRGDIELLKPGLSMLQELSGGLPTLGVIPHLESLKLAEEDSVLLDTVKTQGDGLSAEGRLQEGAGLHTGGNRIDIAVIQFPHVSNYDDIDALALEEGVRIRFIQEPKEIGKPDACILPGTKTTIADLRWMLKRGLFDAVRALSVLGVPIVGLCGGYQMLGKLIIDRDGIEHRGTPKEWGLDLLPITTEFYPKKTTRRVTGRVCSASGFFASINGLQVSGYEIHMGTCTYIGEKSAAFLLDNGTVGSGASDGSVSGEGRGRGSTGGGVLEGSEHEEEKGRRIFSDGMLDGSVSGDGSVWGTYLHGIFDSPGIRRAWLTSLGWNGDGLPSGRSLESVREEEFDRLADHVRRHMDMEMLYYILDENSRNTKKR